MAGCGGDDGEEREPPFITSIGIDGSVDAIAAEPEAVWIAHEDENRVSRAVLEDRYLTVVDDIEGLPRPGALAITDGSLWVLCGDGTLRRIDARSGEPQAPPIRVGRGIDLTLGGGWVWVLTERGLLRVHPGANRVVGAPVRIRAPESIAFAAGSAWVASVELVRVTAQPGARRAEVERLPVDVTAESLAAGDDELWGTYGTLYRIDLANGEPAEESHPSGPVVKRDETAIDALAVDDVAVREDAVWVAGSPREIPAADFAPGITAVLEVDPETLEPTGRPVVAGVGRAQLAANDVGIWLATTGDSRLTVVVPQ